MYDIYTRPYKDAEGNGYASDITDCDTGAAWRVTAKTEREALEAAKAVLDKQNVYAYQCVANGDDIVIPSE